MRRFFTHVVLILSILALYVPAVLVVAQPSTTRRLHMPYSSDPAHNQSIDILDDFYGSLSASTIDLSATYNWTGNHSFAAQLNGPHGAALPTLCSIGDEYQLTSAAPTQQWYKCTAADTWNIQGGGGAGVVTGLTADSGGTTTGATVTIQGGSGITTLRTTDTIQVRTNSQEQNFVQDNGVSPMSCSGAGSEGKFEVLDNGDMKYCDGIGLPDSPLWMSFLPQVNQLFYAASGSTHQANPASCTYVSATPGIDCIANASTGGLVTIKEKSGFAGNNVWGFDLGASLDLTSSVTFTPDTAGKINGSLFLQPSTVTNSVLDKTAPLGTFASYFDIAEISPPGVPSAGVERMYAKAASGICAKDSGGTERCTGSGASGGGGGGVVIGFGTGQKISTGTNTVYVGLFGGIDPTENIVQRPMPAGVFRNMRCTASATPGGSGIAVTVRAGTCGSQGDQPTTVTLTSANAVASDTTNAVTTTAGQCVDVKLVSTGTTLDSAVGCTMDFSPIGIQAFGSGQLLATGTATTYLGMGTGIDPTEVIMQVPSPGATYQNLRCTLSAASGGTGVNVTMRSGACGSLGDSTMTTGNMTAANTVVSDLTHPLTVTSGQCVTFKVVTTGTTTATAVGCSVERVL